MISMGECVLLDFESVRGLERHHFDALVSGFEWQRVKLLAPGMQAWLPAEHEVPVPLSSGKLSNRMESS
jgi:hypothetical protein